MRPAGTTAPVRYVSFDSIVHSVGASQVRRYVELLGRDGVPITLQSFEEEPPDASVREALERAGVTWTPLSFGSHGQLGGLLRVGRAWWAMRGSKFVHARSDLAALAASFGRRRFLWDMRGFWVDERIALGIVTPGSVADRLLRANERRLARRADAIVVLSEAAKADAVARYQISDGDRVVVIPTCVDLDLFEMSTPSTGALKVVLSGTFSNRYDLPSMTSFIELMRARAEVEVEVVSPDPDVSKQFAALGLSHSARRAMPSEMPAVIASSSVGVCFQYADPTTCTNSVPTKLAEFLATGRPVVVSPLLGDMDVIIREFRCGVVLRGTSASELNASVGELFALLDDPELPSRCRAAAERHFSLSGAISTLRRVYEKLA